MDLADLAKTRTWAAESAELWDIKLQARRLGWVEVAIRKGDSTVTELRPTTQDQANPSSLSAMHGMGGQPLHTDGAHLAEPPDFVLLYAEEPNETPTLLWTPEVRAEGEPPLVRGRPSHAADGVFLVRSGQDRFLATAYTDGNGFRYDPGCMTPCDQRARSVVRHFQEAQASALRHAWTAPKQVLVINNHNVLHARAAVSEADVGRVLTRIAHQEAGMTAPYTEDALWIKAKLFLNHSMDDEAERTFEEQALWASLALELLAKSALARVSPLLIAEPNEEGSNLLIASGLVEGTASFMSVAAKTIFTRCARAFRPFNRSEAMTIAAGRNEYLHGGAATITQLPAHAWWPRFWAQAVILVTAQDKTIEDLVGESRVSVVETHLATNRENIEHRVTAYIERAKQRLQLYRSGGMSARLRAEWAKPSDQTAGLPYHDECSCPACGETAILEGGTVEQVESRTEQIAENDYDVWVELTVLPDYFSCPTCRLVLDGYELPARGGSSPGR